MKLFLGVLLLAMVSCSTIHTVQEPNLEQITVFSNSVCPTIYWYPFCLEGRPNSVNFRGVFNNLNGEKKYYLEYYLDSFDTDFPVGVSLKIEGSFYVLKKKSTDYSDTLKIVSEISPDVLNKLINSKNNIFLSYSNRKTSRNIEFGFFRDSAKLREYAQEVKDKVSSLEKMKIVQ